MRLHEFHIWVYPDFLGTSRTVCTRRLPLCMWPFPAGASLHSMVWVRGYNIGVAVPKGLLSWVHWQNSLQQNYTTFAHKAIVEPGGKESVSHVLWDCFLHITSTTWDGSNLTAIVLTSYIWWGKFLCFKGTSLSIAKSPVCHTGCYTGYTLWQ